MANIWWFKELAVNEPADIQGGQPAAGVVGAQTTYTRDGLWHQEPQCESGAETLLWVRRLWSWALLPVMLLVMNRTWMGLILKSYFLKYLERSDDTVCTPAVVQMLPFTEWDFDYLGCSPQRVPTSFTGGQLLLLACKDQKAVIPPHWILLNRASRELPDAARAKGPKKPNAAPNASTEQCLLLRPPVARYKPSLSGNTKPHWYIHNSSKSCFQQRNALQLFRK